MNYAIKDDEGNYIAPRKNYFVKYSGDTTGFVFYNSIKKATEEKDMLNSMGYDFYVEPVDIFRIPKGKRIDSQSYLQYNNT